MKSLTESRWLRFAFFGLLYVAQGIPWGFISKGYTIFLTDQGLSNEALGSVMQVAYLPWSFKILAGPVLDRYRGGRFGRRRPFIVLAEMLMGLPLFTLALADPTSQLGLVSAMIFLHNCFAALQDVAVDGLAVDILPANETGRANSIMWAGKTVGVAIGGGSAVLAKYTNWQTTFVAIAASVWVIMLAPLLLRERPRGDDARLATEGSRLDLRELLRSLLFVPSLVGFLIAFVTPAGYALVGTFTTRLTRAELGLSEERLFAISIAEAIAGVIGSLLGGLIADKVSARRMMGASMVGISLFIGGFGALSHLWSSYAFVALYSVLLQLAICSYSAASLGFFMRLSNPAIGATQFTAYMATTNLCYSFSAKWGGWMADKVGYVNGYFIAAALQVLSVSLLLLCDPQKAEARFRDNEKNAPTLEPA
ncbi:MFS transporter [Polyangium aurulentum]|uniref:MFS transporter n=1 Tax=Polyangium aurulentum TaxID=2567896 RepID=UPI0010AEB278|nr:MFS transporter [Polyangium aurulentum]UQA58191.1 MFS transporter [Polyangium aurulentum]